MYMKLEHWHPGIPGYDVSYRVQCYFDGPDKPHRYTTAQYDLSCDEAPLTFDGNVITVPASFKDNTDKTAVTIRATTRGEDPQTAEFQLPVKCWQKTFEDDFEGDSVDEEKWRVSRRNTLSNIGDVKYAWIPEAATVSDSVLTITFQAGNGREFTLGDGNKYKPEVIVASLSTGGKFEQQFGCFTAKMRLPAPPSGACNPAFWLLPKNCDWGKNYLFRQVKGPRAGMGCGEIDVIEYSPQWKPPQYQITDHWWTVPGGMHIDDEAWHYTDTLWDGNFHEFTCVWTESDLYYYYDGQLIKEQHDLVPTGIPAVMLLSLGESAYRGRKNPTWIGDYDINKMDGMSVSFDYVRVYK